METKQDYIRKVLDAYRRTPETTGVIRHGRRIRQLRVIALNGNYIQAWDLLEVTSVVSCNGITTFQGASSDQQIIEWNNDPALRRFRIDLSHQLSGFTCEWIDRQRGLKINQKCTPGLSAFWCIGAVDAVRKFSHAYGTEGRFAFANLSDDVF